MDLQSIKDVQLNLDQNSYITITGKQYDTGRWINIAVYQGSELVPIESDYDEISLKVKTDSQRILISTLSDSTSSLISVSDNKVLIHLPPAVFYESGKHIAELKLNKNGILTTKTFYIIVDATVYNDDEVLSDAYTTDAVDQLRDEFTKYMNTSISYSVGTDNQFRENDKTDNAKYYKEQADKFATNSAISATTSSNKASEASTSASNAAKSATSASSSATTASTKASEASTSATNASKSESNAKTSETSAKVSETNAKTSETNAKTSETNAKTSETNAKTSEVNAKTSETNAKTSETNANTKATEALNSATKAKTSETNAKTSEVNAKTSETNADTYAIKSQSYCEGNTNTRPNENIDNSKYYYEQTKSMVEGLGGILIPMGTITFAQLKSQQKIAGYTYNISDEFTSDSTFKDGGSIVYPAGTNVYYTSDGYWDCIAGSAVVGIKGANETAYRKGNVNITADNIGLGNVTNNKQVKGLSSGTTSGHVVIWGSDGYTVADSGYTIGSISTSTIDALFE